MPKNKTLLGRSLYIEVCAFHVVDVPKTCPKTWTRIEYRTFPTVLQLLQVQQQGQSRGATNPRMLNRGTLTKAEHSTPNSDIFQDTLI